ncbi:MAG: redoxin domain-containing protein [Chthoniobacterales bacterium]
MALTVGNKAPDFTLSSNSADGIKRITLSDSFGKRNTLLLFVPMAFTSVCTDELCDSSQGLKQLEGLDVTIYGISGDSPFAQQAWAEKENIAVPLLSDYEHEVAKLYDVAYDSFLPDLGLGMSGVAKRSAFIVDKNGIIQYAESSDDPKRLPNFEAIKTKLSDLK